MKIYNSPFIENLDVSFKSVENIEIENYSLRLFYKSFFSLLNLPEKTLKAFYLLIIKDFCV